MDFKKDFTYRIANLNSGKMISVASDSLDDDAHLTQFHWTGRDMQKWFFHPQENRYNSIENQNSGKVISVESDSLDDDAHLTQFHWTGRDMQKWKPEELEQFTTLPTVETGELLPPPQYNNLHDQLPSKTDPVITAYTLAPFFAIFDRKYGSDTAKQVKENPYYLYIKTQYWKRVESHTFAPGETHEYTYTTGITETDQTTAEETTSNTIGLDAGLQFKDLSFGLSKQYTNELKTIKSQTTEKMKQETFTQKVTNSNDYTVAWSKYILCTEYHVQRANGTMLSEPWTVEDKRTTESIFYPNSVVSLSESIEE